MELRDYLDILTTYWRSIVATTLAGFLVALGLVLAATPMYSSQTQVLFTPVAGTGGQDLFYAANYATTRMPVYEELINSPQVLGPVQRGLQGDGLPALAGTSLTASHSATKPILTVTATGKSAKQSARVAELAGDALIKAVDQIESPKPGEPAVVHGSILVPSSASTAPSNHRRLSLVGGTLLAFVVGLSAAVLRRLISRHRKTTKAGGS